MNGEAKTALPAHPGLGMNRPQETTAHPAMGPVAVVTESERMLSALQQLNARVDTCRSQLVTALQRWHGDSPEEAPGPNGPDAPGLSSALQIQIMSLESQLEHLERLTARVTEVF